MQTAGSVKLAWWDRRLIGQVYENPATGVEVVLCALVDHGVGNRVVVEPSGARGEADLGLADCIGRGRINGPVEAHFAGWVARLKPLRLGERGQLLIFSGGAVKENQKRDLAVSRTEDCPVRGAAAFEAAVDDVLGPVGLVGLRDGAFEVVECGGDGSGQIRERADRKMLDPVIDDAAIPLDAAGGYELGGVGDGLLCQCRKRSKQACDGDARSAAGRMHGGFQREL